MADELTELLAKADAARIEALVEALRQAIRFVETVAENDPDDAIADNGMRVCDGLKNDAPRVLNDLRAALEQTP